MHVESLVSETNYLRSGLVERRDSAAACYEAAFAQTPDISGIHAAAEAMVGVIGVTPLEELEFASSQSDNSVTVKREDLSRVRSFKGRGAYNKMRKLSPEEREQGAVIVSAGNAGQGAAMSAKRLKIPLDVYAPLTAPLPKVEAMRGWGATVTQVGDNYSQTAAHVEELLKDDKRARIHAYDQEEVIDGQGTVALELLAQYVARGENLDYVFIPGGGGGLAAGMAKVIKARSPETKVIVVEPEDSNAIQLGYQAGFPVPLDHEPGTFADGLAVRQAGDITLPYILSYVDAVMTVSHDEIVMAMTKFGGEKRSFIEAAAGCCVAGALKYAKLKELTGKELATLATGAGITAGKMGEVLIRGEELTGHEALFTVEIPEEKGSLRRFAQEVVNGHNITEMTYRQNDSATAKVLFGFSMQDDDDKTQFMTTMAGKGYPHTDRSGDDDFKRYDRRIVEKTDNSMAEIGYVITLPDRPGALMDFLDRLGDDWDITEFLYKTDRSMTGAVAVSFAATETRRDELEACLEQTGFDFRHRQLS